MSLQNRLIILAPHHDDESLGCGGFIASQTRDGAHAELIVMTAGWSGITTRGETKQAKNRIRENETRQAARILGISSVRFLRKEDRATANDAHLVHELAGLIQRAQPTTILAPHRDEGDSEHRLLYHATAEAIWLAREGAIWPDIPPARSIVRALFYEVWTPIVKPTKVVDISSTVAQKQQALACYTSQLARRDYTRAVLGLNAYRGALAGVDYAEGFMEQCFE